MKTQFEDIRPYSDEEAVHALKRIAESDIFKQLVHIYYPDSTIEQKKQELQRIETVAHFHQTFGLEIGKKVIKNSTSNCSVKSHSPIFPEIPYSFISNHRDIVMDALILQIYYIEKMNSLVEISFGSNLMMNPLIVDIGKTCQMYKTDRSGTARELYIKLSRLSEYLKFTITEKKKSTWIAQRNGRTKDGFDKTDPGLVKMYSMSGRKDFKNHFIQMNITPISISYQYEPCDYMKVREIYFKQIGGVYKKHKNEDLESIIYGLNQQKGNTSLMITKTISEEEINNLSDNYFTFCHELTKLIDQRIIENYTFWNTNYIAFDMLHHTDNYKSKYTESEWIAFKKYMEEKLSLIQDIEEPQILEKLFLELYAHPLENKAEWHDFCSF